MLSAESEQLQQLVVTPQQSLPASEMYDTQIPVRSKDTFWKGCVQTCRCADALVARRSTCGPTAPTHTSPSHIPGISPHLMRRSCQNGGMPSTCPGSPCANECARLCSWPERSWARFSSSLRQRASRSSRLSSHEPPGGHPTPPEAQPGPTSCPGWLAEAGSGHTSRRRGSRGVIGRAPSPPLADARYDSTRPVIGDSKVTNLCWCDDFAGLRTTVAFFVDSVADLLTARFAA